LPTLEVPGEWTTLFHGRSRRAFEAALPRVLAGRRWFGGKARRLESVELLDAVPLSHGGGAGGAVLIMVRVIYRDAEDEVYQAPVAFACGGLAAAIERDEPHAVLIRLRTGDCEEGILYDAVYSREFRRGLLDSILARRRFKG